MEQTRDSVLWYGESVGCELLNFFVVSEKMKEIETILADLDERIPRPEKCVQITVYGGGPDESRMRATRDGFLRLGLEIMRAAFAKPTVPEHPHILDVNVDAILTDDSEVGIDWFERVETITQPEVELRFRDKLAPAVIALILIAILICTVVGAGTIIWWITR